jgi:hypothetical protein
MMERTSGGLDLGLIRRFFFAPGVPDVAIFDKLRYVVPESATFGLPGLFSGGTLFLRRYFRFWLTWAG